MAFDWSPSRLKFFKNQVEKGMTDKEVCAAMSKRYKGYGWTVHMVRSQRGRMERADTIKLGLSGSSTHNRKEKKETVVAKIPSQRWSPQADRKLTKLYLEGLNNKQIARKLKKEGLRDNYNPGAVGDRLSLLRKCKRRLLLSQPPKPLKPAKVPGRLGVLLQAILSELREIRVEISKMHQRKNAKEREKDVQNFVKALTESL